MLRTGRFAAILLATLFVIGTVAGIALGVSTATHVEHEAFDTISSQNQDSPSATLVVDPDDTTNYDSIQAAIDDAVAGDTVEVRTGTYDEYLTVDKDITLVAPEGATLDGTAFDVSPNLMYITGDAAPVIDGFTLESGLDGVEAEESDGDWTIRNTVISNSSGYGVDVLAATANWTLRNVTVENSGNDGVRALNAEGDWTIRGSAINDNGDDGVDARNTAGDWSLQDVEITNNVGNGVLASSNFGEDDSSGDWEIHGATITDNGGQGVSTPGATGAWVIQETTISGGNNGIGASYTTGNWTIRNTTITDTVIGVYAISTDGVWTIQDTEIQNPFSHGIQVSGSTGDWAIRDSTITNALGKGIDAGSEISLVQSKLTTGDWTIRNVTIEGSGSEGVDVTDATGNWSIRNASISESGSAGVFAENTSGQWEIHQSTIADNSQGVDATDAHVQGDATNNWWGAPSGPYHAEDNPDGEGDSVAGNLVFEPWLGTEVSIVSTELAETTVTVGESIEVTATVENTGTRDGELSLELRVGDAVVETHTVELAVGESETITVSHQPDTPGEVTVYLNDAEVGVVMVEEDEVEPTPTPTPTQTPTPTPTPSEPTPTPTQADSPTPTPAGTPTPTPSGDSIPGFGILVGLFGLGGVGYTLNCWLSMRDESE